MVVRHFAKVKVASSNLATRSNSLDVEYNTFVVAEADNGIRESVIPSKFETGDSRLSYKDLKVRVLSCLSCTGMW